MSENDLPDSRSATCPEEREKLRQLVINRNLCGVANDSKWDELIIALRSLPEGRPRYRFKSIDGPPSSWDGDWFYQLPFPFLSVEWLDLSPASTVQKDTASKAADRFDWLVRLLKKIGLDFRVGPSMIRIFGYSPRNLDGFDD
jgi:hypothetical protein